MQTTPISTVQGDGLFSPLAGQEVRIRGVVTGSTRKGFFVQDLRKGPPDCSHGVFVFRPRRPPRTGAVVEVEGKVVDYRTSESDRPTTQVHAARLRTVDRRGPRLDPVWLTADLLERPPEELARELNRREGMLVGLAAGATFVAPSNPYGDYVVLPAGSGLPRTPSGGVLLDPARPARWLPSFRIRDYDHSPRVDVGDHLRSDVVGPLNYRVGSYQISATGPIRVEAAALARIRPASLTPRDDAVTILTLNSFNLDPKVEDPARVHDPRRDVDDDVGDGRYDGLAAAIVRDAHAPDLIALQEVQDDDGAERSGRVDADGNYATLIAAIRRAGGPPYAWVDRPPQPEADGGQPGGNIRNAYLYRPDRLELREESVRRLGEGHAAFEDSRKPLLARFRFRDSELAVINVHLASKRHQYSLFAPQTPGFDPRLAVRVEQARLVRDRVLALREEGVPYYVTGDFNDTEESETLRSLVGTGSVNLTRSLPREERYDYNHRGISQALIHGIVPEGLPAEYEILHGNELLGTPPGTRGGRATDHAYALARLQPGRPG